MSIIKKFLDEARLNSNEAIQEFYNKTKTQSKGLIRRIINILKNKRYSDINIHGVLERFNSKDLVDGCYTVPDDVVEIGNFAFYDNKDIKKIIIPSSVKKIGLNAFRDCRYLKEVIFNEGLVRIGQDAFYYSGVEEINLPETVESIGAGAFSHCIDLKSCHLPKKIVFLGNSILSHCILLSKVNIPENLAILPDYCFSECKNLKNIVLPENLQAIRDYAFFSCDRLEHIRIPNSVNYIGNNAFDICEGLTQIRLPDNLKVLNHYVFRRCWELERVKLPVNLEEIKCSFSYCKNLQKIIIPKSVEKIDKHAFYSSHLREITINNKKVSLSSQQANLLGIYFPFYNYATKNNLFIPKNKEIILKTKDEEVENFYKYSTIWGKILDRYLELQKESIEQLTVSMQVDEIVSNLYQISVVLGLFQNLSVAKRKELNHFLEKNILTINPLDLHRVFGGLETEIHGYNKEFAEFYMKNYTPPVYDNEGNVLYFMEAVEDYYDDEDDYDEYYDGEDEEDETNLEDEVEEDCFDPNEVEIISYVEQAYNNWDLVKEAFPNKTVLNHRERASENNNLTLEDVIHALNCIEYENVHEGNEEMAERVSKYGYSQDEFEQLQAWWELGKTIVKERTLTLNQDNNENIVRYELLDNDDEEILILGEETNCCQTVNDAGRECLKYGVTKNNSGFIKFSYKGRIIGQSWVWYNKKTKTVCLDNIEIPTLWIKQIRKHKELEKAFVDCLKRLADGFANSMQVDKVTVGAGFNDLSVIHEFDYIEGKTSPTPADYNGYTDAYSIQYVLYDKALDKTDRFTKTDDDNISFEIPPTSVETF